jgi:aromatase
VTTHTENSVRIQAPPDLVWHVTNDVAGWPRIFPGCAAVEVLDTAERYVRFAYTGRRGLGRQGTPWVAERRLDPARMVVEGRRLEPGRFDFFTTRWTYQPTETGTRVSLTQQFRLTASAGGQDQHVASALTDRCQVELESAKAAVEALTSALTGQVLPGVDGSPVSFDTYRGCPLVVVLGNRRTQQAGHAILEALRSHPATINIPVVQVSHLAGVPTALAPMAIRHITAGYHCQLGDLGARRLTVGGSAADEADLLRIGLDWNGSVTGRFGFTDTDESPLVLVFDQRQHMIAGIRATPADTFARIRTGLAAPEPLAS